MKSEALGGMATAMAIAGRAARPCDVCGRERARWYCAADEAYLCEPCDGSVHNANALASRHERVRLAPNGAPMKIDRHRKDETSLGGGEEPSGAPAATDRLAITSRKKQLKYSRTAPPTALQTNPSNPAQQVQAFEVKLERSSPEDAQIYFDELPGNPSSPFDSPLREGKGEPDYAHEFMVFDDCEVDDVLSPEECEGDGAAGGVESSAGDFDTLSNTTAGEEDSEPMGAEEEKPEPGIFLPLTTGTNSSGFVQSMKEDESSHVPSLRLNYADVLNAWSDRGTLWTGGHAQTVPEDSTSDAAANPDHAVVPLLSGEDISSAREARVNRYREKRRTRLFSKKIRYEVRKLNAERRPRMKGRFVKRSAGEQ